MGRFFFIYLYIKSYYLSLVIINYKYIYLFILFYLKKKNLKIIHFQIYFQNIFKYILQIYSSNIFLKYILQIYVLIEFIPTYPTRFIPLLHYYSMMHVTKCD